MVGEEALEDLDDLAFDSPVVGGELLQKWFDDLLIKCIFAHLGGKVFKVFSNSKCNLAVRFFHVAENDGEKGFSHKLS